MMKTTYIQKLGATKVLPTMTVKEARTANKQRTELNRFWKKTALVYIQKTTGRNLKEELAGWKRVKYVHDLKVTGTVTVNLYTCDDNAPDVLTETFKVPKKFLLN